jgi:hypothetical protein
MSTITTTIHWLSILLPFANELAITLSHSGIPIFKKLYRSCIEGFLIDDEATKHKMEKKICTLHDNYHKIFFDVLAYFGIMLNICKNAIQYGYTIGVFSGLNLVVWSMLITNMYLGPCIHYITHFFHMKSPFMYILVGIILITLLVIITHYTEIWIQSAAGSIVIDPDVEKHVKKMES